MKVGEMRVSRREPGGTLQSYILPCFLFFLFSHHAPNQTNLGPRCPALEVVVLHLSCILKSEHTTARFQ